MPGVYRIKLKGLLNAEGTRYITAQRLPRVKPRYQTGCQPEGGDSGGPVAIRFRDALECWGMPFSPTHGVLVSPKILEDTRGRGSRFSAFAELLFFAEGFQVGEVLLSSHSLLVGDELVASDIGDRDIAIFPLYPV